MAKKTKSSTSYGVQALERALYLMEMIKEKGGADANYLAKELGVHRSSVYRILGSSTSCASWPYRTWRS